MATEKIPYKIYLSEDEMPRTWYNVRADMKNKPAPLLNPGTGEPMGFDDLRPVFCDELIRQYDRSVQQDKVWDYSVVQHLRRIEGQVMGIAGLGRIGQSVAKKAKGFDMEVIAYDPYLPPEIAEKLGVKLVDFDTLLAEADVISIHMNLTEENYHMFNKETFRKCKKQPIIVNEGRGALISDDDLLWALEEGYVRGAALDMLESENPDLNNCKLLGRDDVLLTPHSGYFSDTSNYLVAKLSMDNALYYYNGEYDKVKVIRNGVNA